MKRSLTLTEVEDICDQIPINPSIPFETAVSVREGLIRTIRNQLTEIQIYPEGIPELKKEVMMEYHRSLLQPGEMVGVQAATSIGEPVTQMSLNAFHYSGISTIGIASGVPRVEEILNASKKQKLSVMNLYFKEQKSIEEAREHAHRGVIEVYLSTLTKRITAHYVSSIDELGEETQWYKLFFSIFHDPIHNQYGELELNWMVRFELDRDLMFKHRVTTLQIAEKIENSFRDLYAIPSPDTIGLIDVYIDFKSIKLKKVENKFEQFKGFSVESRCIQNVVIPYMKDIHISGMQGIEDIQLQEDSAGRWSIMTKGTNLYAAFTDQELDYTRCRSSDIWEIFRVLGVEACRQFIIEEFYKVLSVGGASVGRRHIELLADSMTYQGKISSVNRYGIDRNQIGPMAKASFEESVRNFFIAAVNGETDQMGVSASLMAGKLVKCGTGFMEMVLNEDMLKSVRTPPLSEIVKPIPNPIIKPMIPKQVTLPKVVASQRAVEAPASVLPNLLTGKSIYSNVVLPGLKNIEVKEKEPTKISFMKKTKPQPVHKDVVIDFEEDD